MRLFFALWAALLITLPGWAQERVRNVRVGVADASRLEIHYDLLTAQPGDSVYFDVRSRLRGPLRVAPAFVRGDVGTRITAGSDRRIVWDALANGYPLNEEIQVIVRVKTGLPPTSTEPTIARQQPPVTPSAAKPVPATPQPTRPNPESALTDPAVQPRKRYAGPAWALLSAVAPGAGNIFVQTPEPKVGLRPMLTVGTYVLLIYGLRERQKSRDDYALYEEQKNRAAGEPYYLTANAHHHRYYLATRGAAIVAAADVVLTLIRGMRNGRLSERRDQSLRFKPGLQAGYPTVVMHYTF